MSKGMKQKIGLVCAFMNKPEILILDEPTSGLDPLMQNKFIDLILKEKKRGATVLMSSHMFEEVERTCDRTVIIKAGHIVAVEDIAKLKSGKRKFFTVQVSTKEQARQLAKEFAVKESAVNEDVVTIGVKGTVDEFIKKLSQYQVLDLGIQTQNLEDLFMHFYGGEQDVK